MRGVRFKGDFGRVNVNGVDVTDLLDGFEIKDGFNGIAYAFDPTGLAEDMARTSQASRQAADAFTAFDEVFRRADANKRKKTDDFIRWLARQGDGGVHP